MPAARISALRVGHVASLAHIVPAWSVALKVKPGIFLKRWSAKLFPLDNQPSGAAHNLLQKYNRVGNKFIEYRPKKFRKDHPDLAKPHTAWRAAALRQSRKNQAAKKRFVELLC